MIKEIFALLVVQLLLGFVHAQCKHKIFCNPDILQAAASSNLFSDSKTFVDLVLTVPIEQALINFQKQTHQQFFKQNFHPDPQILLSPVQFPDYQQNPQLLNKIQDPQLKQFASELNKRWNLLGKKVNLSAAATVGTCKVDCSSFLPEINNFTMLVPGGRFRESYYWDTYWIVLGLIATDMLDTAENIILNFAAIIDRYGYIPNGLRQYYLTRSQPPFLFLMVKDLANAFRAKGNPERAWKLQKQLFKYLNTQHEYWSATHKLSTFIDGTYYELNQYRANTKNARPESFRQDMQTVRNILSTEQKIRVWKGLSSMAESGWDFSSRWLRNTQLSSTQIDRIIPSDLIALLGMMQKYLVELSLNFFYPAFLQKYTFKYTQKISYFKAIKRNGRFPDIKLDGNHQTDYVYPTDFMPFIFLQEKIDLTSIYQEVVNPQTSTLPTAQQWDSPNVWAPNNWIIHQVTSGQQAKKYATQWILTTYCSYKKHNAIYQKYDARAYGQRGQGGQYQPQIGFGWTNGLALHYLSLYPQTKAIQC